MILDFLWISYGFLSFSIGFPVDFFISSPSQPELGRGPPDGQGSEVRPAAQRGGDATRNAPCNASAPGQRGRGSSQSRRGLVLRNKIYGMYKFTIYYDLYIYIYIDKTDTQFDNEYDYS